MLCIKNRPYSITYAEHCPRVLGNKHASHGTVAVLRRIVALMRTAWPAVEIEIRADAGFAVPAVYDYCEAEGID